LVAYDGNASAHALRQLSLPAVRTEQCVTFVATRLTAAISRDTLQRCRNETNDGL
jgi:hypothetical protein